MPDSHQLPDLRKPSALRNLGPAMDRWLGEVGIHTIADLRAMGAEQAWARLRFQLGPRVNLIALYALDAALADTDWRHIPEARKAGLREFARTCRQRSAE